MTDTPANAPRHPLRRFLEAFTGPWTKGNLFSWAGIIFAIFFIKGCIIDQYTIPSGSMEPTLMGDPAFFRGDRVLVNKWIFGPRIPFTTKRLWKWGEPERWNIVVFRSIDPKAEHPILIKRVVGLPGERVKIKDGKIMINGAVVEPPESLREVLHYVDHLEFTELDKQRQILRLAQVNQPLPVLNPEHPPVARLYEAMERLHPQVKDLDVSALTAAEVTALCAGIDHQVVNLIGNIYEYVQPEMNYGIRDEDAFSLVPEGHYLLLGDNSNESLDGRMYGWVPHNHLYGRTFAVWWPWSHRHDFTGFSKTWWGRLLLYGIPAVLIAMEIRGAVLRRREKKAEKVKEKKA